MFLDFQVEDAELWEMSFYKWRYSVTNKNAYENAIKHLCCMFLLYSPVWTQAQYKLDVNLSAPIRPVTHCASGSLYGFTETLPVDVATMVAPFKPNVFANTYFSGNGHQ